MNTDHILSTLNKHEVAYVLIGGMNFLLRHAPVLTYDVDVWIDDEPANRERCETALSELQAEWGPSDNDWVPVAARKPGWLETQALYCLISPYGAIDVFRSVKGLESWTTCRDRAQSERTPAGTAYLGLSDADMLRCQLVLDRGQQKPERIRVLSKALGEPGDE